ncbi:MAG: hypothetical protein WDN44_06220 [Sphingomonas sp.]
MSPNFRGGEASPFFVQRGDKAFAYQGDRPVRQFDRDGHATHARRRPRPRGRAGRARCPRQHDRAGHARDDARRGPIEPPPQPDADAVAFPLGPRSSRPTTSRTHSPRLPPPTTPTSRWRQPQRTPERTPDR